MSDRTAELIDTLTQMDKAYNRCTCNCHNDEDILPESSTEVYFACTCNIYEGRCRLLQFQSQMARYNEWFDCCHAQFLKRIHPSRYLDETICCWLGIFLLIKVYVNGKQYRF